MIAPALLVATLVATANTLDCSQYLTDQLNQLPEEVTITKLKSTTIVELYGGHAVLKCKGRTYYAYILK